MNTLVRPALSLLAALTLVTGLAYPLAVTGIAQTAFPDQAAGSLVRLGDRPVGSRLLGQPFSEARYFWSRPSATSPMPYNAANSSGASTPMGAEAAQLFNMFVNAGNGAKDFSGIIKMLEGK